MKGSGGIYIVEVDGKVVARKTGGEFPTEDAVVDAVRRAQA
mgnify:CR=1 FL=1